jgi:hypothetical protein
MTLEQDLQAAMDADDPVELARIEALLDAEDASTRLRLAEPRALKDAALYYIRRGWPVFPCRPGGKTPGIGNPHPEGSAERKTCRGECGQDGHGLYDATLDETKIWEWWTQNPEFNIGLPTGLAFDVIDIDGHQGMESLRQFMRTVVPDTPEHKWTNTDDVLPKIGSVLTPRHPGTHRYVKPTGAGNKAAMGKKLPGIDYRGAGGYVLAPPSRTEHGMYVWATPIPDGAA